MMASTAGYRTAYPLQFMSVQDSKAREEKVAAREQQQQPPLHSSKNTQLNEIEVLLNELIAIRKARQQKSTRDESLAEAYQKKKLLLNVKWFALESSGEMAQVANRSMLQQLGQLRNQLLAEEQQEVSAKAPDSRHELSRIAAVKKAGLQPTIPLTTANAALLVSKANLKTAVPDSMVPQNNEIPQALRDMQPAGVDSAIDAATLQQLTHELMTLASELGESYQTILDESQRAVMTVLLRNPTVLQHRALPQNQIASAELPLLTPPKTTPTLSIEQMLMALRAIAKAASLVEIDTKSKSSQIVQESMARMAVKNLRENSALQDKAREQQRSAERRGNIFKWLTRIVMAVVGVLVSALTAGFGAMLFSLLFTVVEVVLEETVGFSLTSKIAEGIGKGLAAFMKVCGASGEWVEHVANALAQIIIMVASIVVAKGASKLSNLPCVQKLLTVMRGMKGGKLLFRAIDVKKLPQLLQIFAKYQSVIRLGQGAMQLSFGATEVAKSVPAAQTQRDLAANDTEMMTIDKLAEIVRQMLKNTPKSLTQSTEMAKELAEQASDMLKRGYRVNDVIALNMTNGRR